MTTIRLPPQSCEFEDHAGVKCAVFDLDGTLHPGATGILLLRRLVANGCCDAAKSRELFDFLGQVNELELRTTHMARRAYELFAAAVCGASVAQVRHVAASLWRTECHAVFPAIRGLVSALADSGYRTVLISGSPDDIVREAAAELGMARSQGAVFTSRMGKYGGGLALAPGIRGTKLAILPTLFPGQKIDLRNSFAIGNTEGDIDLLRAVGNAIAFEPSTPLQAAAAEFGWPVIDREATVDTVLALLTPNPSQFPVGDIARGNHS